MKKILLHYVNYQIGGTNTVINDIRTSYLKEKYSFVLLKQTEACGFNLIKAFCFVNKYKKLIREEQADGIYVCGLQYSGFLITLASKLSGIPQIFLSVHGSEWDDKRGGLRKTILKYIIEPLAVRMSDKVFTVCKSELDSNGAIRIGKHNNIFGVVYNRYPDIDFDSVSSGFRKLNNISEDRIVVSVVGRVVEDKGFDHIIKAIRGLNDNRYLFLVVGDGEYMDYVKNETKDLRLNDNLRLLGKRTDVYEILKETDVFLFASFHENHSLALMEAVNMRCAVICTNVGGTVEIIDDHETGLYIPPRDSNSMISALKEMEDSRLRNRFVSEALLRIPERFSAQNTLGELEKVFN